MSKERTPDPQDDSWLQPLADRIAGTIEAHSLMGPMAWQYWPEEGLHHLIFFPRSILLKGGAQDGQQVVPGYSVDIQAVSAMLQRVDSVYWTTQGLGGDDEGPRISIEGLYEGHQVWLRLLAEPPADEEPGMELEMTE